MFRICLFGQPYFFWNEQPIKFTAPPKALPLLGYLLIHRDRPVERLYLSSLLWPDQPEADARANLRRHLHHLHSFLPDLPPGVPWLLTDELTVRWNPDAPYALDVAEFERLGSAPDTRAEAVTYYRGDFLETLYDDWIIIARERLREQYFGLLIQLALDCRARCDYAQASTYTGQLLAQDALREDTLRLHITLRYQAGDRAGAIQAYEKFQHLLRQELDVDPMPETEAIAEAILHNRPLSAAGPSGSPQRTAVECQSQAPRLPFVGRQAEMARLEAYWQRVRCGEGCLLWLSGEAGIGKTRLVREFAQQVETQGGRILYGSTLPGETAPYQAFRDALLSALPFLAAVELEPIWLSALAVLLPDLRQRCERPLPVLPRLDENNQRIRLFEALAKTLQELARPRPMLLILEDLHWAGGGTLALLEYLSRQIGQAGVLILVTYREEEVDHEHPLSRLRHRLQAGGLCGHLTLARLSVDAVADLLARLPFPRDVQQTASSVAAPLLAAPLLAAQVHTQSAGVPLFLELLLPQWAEGQPGLMALHLSSADLHTVIQHRLEHLSPSALALAEVAAVAGPAFEFDLVRTVGGWGEAQAFDALGDLLDHHLVCESPGRSRFDYVFDHHLIQMAVYDAMPPEVRCRRHHRMAQVMEKRDLYPAEAYASEIGNHYERCGEAEIAANYYLQAVHHSLSLYADGDALSYATRALSLANAPRLRFDILAQREAIYRRIGERALQRADLEEMIRLVEALHDPQQACEVLLRRILYHRVISERPAEATFLAELKARAEAMGDLRWQMLALSHRAAYLSLVGRLDECKADLLDALESYRRCGDVAGQVDCYCQLGQRAIRTGQHDEIPRWLAQAKELLERQQDVNLSLKLLRLEERAAYVRGDFSQAYETGQQMLDLTRKIGDRDGELAVLMSLALSTSRLLRVDETYQRYRECEALSIRLGNREIQAGNWVNQGIFCDRLGRHKDALLVYQKALEVFQDLGNTYGQQLCLLNFGNVLSNLGDYSSAKGYILQALALADQNKGSRARALGVLGTVERELGELDQSVAHIQEGLDIRRSAGMALEWNLSELALTYLRMGRLADAQQAAEQAVASWGPNTGPRLHYQKDLWVAAQVYHALEQPERAQATLAQAVQVLQELAEEIAEPEMKMAFLNVLHNRQIAAACERGEWPSIS